MNKIIFLGIAVLMLSGKTYGQTFKDIYQKSISDNQKINYPHLREADAVWSKRVYRIIDLREKANLNLYYPKEATNDGRQNFVSILLDEIKAGRLNAYDPEKTADSAVAHVTYSDIEPLMGVGTKSITITDPTTGATRDSIIPTPENRDVITQLVLYEEWFFDKKQSKLDVRIIGIQPRWLGQDQTGRLVHRPLFWIRYDEIRDILAKKEAFNPSNDAQRLSFDDIFMQRRFNSFISAESNVYNDRFIIQYTIGKDAMFEAERIKKDLFNFEHDLWEY
jgi:gliding motility associated protien GldN